MHNCCQHQLSNQKNVHIFDGAVIKEIIQNYSEDLLQLLRQQQ
jgi:hypothetical protein